MSDILTIAGVEILPGETRKIELHTARLYTDTEIFIPVHITRSKRPGPTLFVCAAIHGDELNGIEIIGRLLKHRALRDIRGTLIAVPMVNVHGVLQQSRYLPDRRDLNRSFPGSKKGSLAGRTADLFMTEIVSKADYGVDLHTGALHRSNLPQIRANFNSPEALELARAFGVPMLLHSDVRDGSLRESAEARGIPILLYEGGEALRYDELCIRAGVRGVINVMRHIGMLRRGRARSHPTEPLVANQSSWVRALESGFVNHHKRLGDTVAKGDVLATIHNPYGEPLSRVTSPAGGIIIGKQNIPLVQEGEAMYNIAFFKQQNLGEVREHIEQLQEDLSREKSKPAP